jgi:prepilin-type N-terminal cleavage/methylation domain-containing protein
VRNRGGHGFTLVELLLAIGIAGAVLMITLGGVRAGLAAWHRSEARTARLDHARGVALLLERAIEGAFPYRITPERAQEPRVLFEGRADRLTLATLSPPLPGPGPIAFTAVSVAGESAGLTLRQQVLPDRLALERRAPALVDPRTRAVRFRYLGEEPGAWRDAWDMAQEEALPRVVEITFEAGHAARQVFRVPIRAAGR